MKIFSLPLNPKLNQKQFEEYCAYLGQYQDWIYDIYFTCRIPPFGQDAMGSVFVSEDKTTLFDNALMIQKSLGIKISATFNNVNVSPKYDNYKLFIENDEKIYMPYHYGVNEYGLPEKRKIPEPEKINI